MCLVSPPSRPALALCFLAQVASRAFAVKPAAAAAETKKKVQPLSFGIVTRVKDGVAFARDLGFASFGELVIFVPSPARLKTLQKEQGTVNYVDGMIVGLERDLTSVVILGNERLVKVGDRLLNVLVEHDYYHAKQMYSKLTQNYFLNLPSRIVYGI